MQFEQTQQPWPRKEPNGADANPVSNNQNEINVSSEHTGSIPLNKEGKRYSMKQAFDIWFDNEDGILEDVSVAVKAGENYKLSKPLPIYHLDFAHTSNSSTEDTSASRSDADSVAAVEKGVNGSVGKSQPEAPPNLSKSSDRQETAQGSAQPVLLQPESINWVYLDPAGNEQGPFTGDIMQEWLTDGYLSLDLQIRRQEEPRFVTLKEFCETVQNFIQPFKVPLPRVPSEPAHLPMPGAFQPQVADPPVSTGSHNGYGSNGGFKNGVQPVGGGHQQSPFGSNLYSQILPNGGLGAANIRTPSSNPLFDFMGSSDYPLMNAQYPAGSQFGLDAMNPSLSFGQLHMPSLLQQQISSQQPSLSRSSSGWGMENPLQGSLPSTPTTSGAPVPLSMTQPSLGQSSLNQSGSMSPWINRVQSMSRVSSPFVPTTTLTNDSSEKVEDNLLQDLHSSMVSGILKEEDQNRGPDHEVLPDLPATSTGIKFQDEPFLRASTESATPIAVVTTDGQNVEHPRPQAEITKATESESIVVPEAEHVQPEIVQGVDISSVAKADESASAAAAAPWAVSKALKQDSPPLTLKQIQEMEAERLQREKQLKAEMKQEIALANALAATKLEEKTPEKVSFNWATSKPSTAKKTLAEIQKEEEAEAAKSKAAKSASASSSKVSLATALASTPVKEDGGAWTTVTSKKPVLKKPVSAAAQPGISYSSLSGAINPQVLRNASSGVVPTTSVNTQAVKEDFLIWARSAMTNLYPSVSKNDLLEVFTTLPVHADSAQLISETIYSSSATMDGRRFAQEFMKKRQQVEKQIGPSVPESWSSAIISSADKIPVVDDEGWSTSVKSKKKGRKN